MAYVADCHATVDLPGFRTKERPRCLAGWCRQAKAEFIRRCWLPASVLERKMRQTA